MEAVEINSSDGENPIILDFQKLRKSALVLRALNHELRKKIVQLLNEHQEMFVTDIYVQLRVEQSVASQHLAILRKAGIVSTSRKGKFIIYSLDKERIKEIANFVGEIA